MLKKPITFVLAFVMLLSLAACGGESGGVPVQRADQLGIAAAAGERYAAMVVSEEVSQIKRDPGMTLSLLNLSTKSSFLSWKR